MYTLLLLAASSHKLPTKILYAHHISHIQKLCNTIFIYIHTDIQIPDTNLRNVLITIKL
jgi:hypothetical protein